MMRTAIVLITLLCSPRLLLAQDPDGMNKDKPDETKRTEDAANVEDRLRRLENALDLDSTPRLQDDFKIYWKDGIRFGNDEFKFKLGAVIQNDYAWITEDDEIRTTVGRQEDGTQFRRARLSLSGQIYKNIIFKAQYDFAGGDADFKDVYIGISKPVSFISSVKVGQFKIPFSLEDPTSSGNITFMEYSLITQAFAPSRKTGVAVFGHTENEMITFGIGYYRLAEDDGDVKQDGGSGISLRITVVPFENEESEIGSHIGISIKREGYDDAGSKQIKGDPEIGLADTLITQTAVDPQGDLIVFGLEGAFWWQALRFQFEVYSGEASNDPGSDDLDALGYYLQLSYWLTGERPSYKKSAAVFSGVKPVKNFGLDGEGLGAFEIAVRYGFLSLETGNNEQELANTVFGVNWHLNPKTRIMLNLVLSDRDTGLSAADGSVQALMLRFQIGF